MKRILIFLCTICLIGFCTILQDIIIILLNSFCHTLRCLLIQCYRCHCLCILRCSEKGICISLILAFYKEDKFVIIVLCFFAEHGSIVFCTVCLV